MAALVLGGFEFADFEIPDKINFGGKQTLAVHKQIGGQRVIDAMGTDPEDIRWSGRFQGGDVVSRAARLEAMRDAGGKVTLACGAVIKTVVVKEFSYDYERPYQAPYQITCVVAPDDAGDPLQSLDDLVGQDAAAFSDQVDQFNTNAEAGP
jgi:hypothetical protein